MPDCAAPIRTWKLQDAKARFSELVREARASDPQAVTVHGKEAVVVLSAEEFEKLVGPPAPEPSLLDVMQACPVPGFKFEFPSVRVRVRKPAF